MRAALLYTLLAPPRWERFCRLFVGKRRGLKDMPQTVLFTVVLVGLVVVASGTCAVIFLCDCLSAPQTSGDAATGFDISLALFTASWWLLTAHLKGKPIGRMVQLVLTAIASLFPLFTLIGIPLIVSLIRNDDVRRWYRPDVA